VECTVTDNGTGIDADFLGKIFDKSETDSGDTEGKGLALRL
jgi:signal transduction histidine kinase